MNALQTLTELEYQGRYRGKTIPEYARTKKKYADKKANGLTKCIVDWIRLNGGHAERVNVHGRPIDRTKVITNCLGQSQRIGSIDWIQAGGTKGSADIHGVINGKAVLIEVKIGRDKLSQEQKNYRHKVTQAGAFYFIAQSFDQFMEFYNQIQH